jgi:hypothetical protein
MTEGPRVSDAVVAALRFQQLGVAQPSLASPLYEALIGAALDDIEHGGPTAAVLAQVPTDLDPIADAVSLRFLGAVHRLVLEGAADRLSRWYPTAGGAFDPAVDGPAAGAEFVATVEEFATDVVAGLSVGVQTNEVGRCATLAVGFTEVLRTFGLPLRLLELGSSAGLNLRWDRWRYEAGTTSWGDPEARLRFVSNYRAPEPDVSAPIGPGAAVADRRGCDRSPIDAATAEGQLLLRSFVWPDQADRHTRLDAAIAAATADPVAVEAADAAVWLADRLAEPADATSTVVFHSIVWQYLPVTTRDGIVDALASAGSAATPGRPLTWLRMEPGEDPARAAELRLRTWPGGDDRLLAKTGYHGHPVWRSP